ncbi:hypothetical protein BZZ01_11650 [Nostocales cyanobacterium HT-58-2]|nr:hypothetical protein BZZ01_11650 [Nostocales cyanobacterium HT-58-2]
MGLNPEQLRQHCEIIIHSRRIKNKIVVLCEGEGGIWNLERRPSPQSYGKMEQMPDANFYNACVPKWWNQYRPQFFNCGDRKDVLNTYFTLLELHNEDSTNSYLSPEKLFAIVDLDLQLQKIDNYIFSNTEEIFCNLYEKSEVNKQKASQHRIWVTGLIHKEAYFLIPELQSIFNNFPTTPIYKGSPLLLENVYISMVNEIEIDSDLKNNFKRAFNRINYCSELNFSGVDELCDSWKFNFHNNPDDLCKNKLVIALLTIKKAKDYWNQIQPSTDWTASTEVFREQLLLAIGRFYSDQSNDARYHISFLLETLYQFI